MQYIVKNIVKNYKSFDTKNQSLTTENYQLNQVTAVTLHI